MKSILLFLFLAGLAYICALGIEHAETERLAAPTSTYQFREAEQIAHHWSYWLSGTVLLVVGFGLGRLTHQLPKLRIGETGA